MKVTPEILSHWELDKVIPTFASCRKIISYLGYAPFDEIRQVGSQNAKSNETLGVATLDAHNLETLGSKLRRERARWRLYRYECAALLRV